MIINTQFYTKYRPRVFYQVCFILMKDTGTVTPLDAAGVNRTIFHNHSKSATCDRPVTKKRKDTGYRQANRQGR